MKKIEGENGSEEGEIKREGGERKRWNRKPERAQGSLSLGIGEARSFYEVKHLQQCVKDELIDLSDNNNLDHDYVYGFRIETCVDRYMEYDEEVMMRAAVEQSLFENGGGRRPTPANEAAIKGLERLMIKDNEDTNCSICLEEFDVNKEEKRFKVTMPCKHEFHESCIIQWLHTNHVCPLCRYQLPVMGDSKE
ncbi:uncharacterized protein [Spinacia oleracea]|uniref:RING-type E3 ubiquitin transferase n=1 Tax=Spinacia oleracea TaxID=3562 RepID=A0A9R0HYS9_SPIOL|nr:uncharacterized protein LOC110779031 [Spinacia oleracea]